jgi:hypothetical protein
MSSTVNRMVVLCMLRPQTEVKCENEGLRAIFINRKLSGGVRIANIAVSDA